MPSSFSPNLRIELIANGEQAGNWGSTTNTNLGTLVEDAISGYETVSVTTSDQAFTNADGAADQARNAMIELTTTTGAVFNVYAPPSPKLYVIFNASAHAATIFNSTVIGNTTAAGTGVVVPAGRRLFVMTDGTDFSFITAPATSVNTPNTLVERDGSGNFAAGTITANLTGNVTGNVTGNAATATRLTGSWDAVPTGTRMMFAQTAAPTGWTKDVSQNDKALRVVSGAASTGGTVAFTTAFASKTVAGTVGDTTLSIDQLPAHTHTVGPFVRDEAGGVNYSGGNFGRPRSLNTSSTGGNAAHNHSFTGTAINMAVQYIDVIIAAKD